ncbi:glutamyl-tRNA amidotransferase [Chamaesiphon sp. GL140_3_metabinner_50]|uniref:allophanate hydrolase-related protein n=1 Tax=Chamaesiphon sp. GL140_3_metabinner_50 TaxID=2970812 RepID=UPI003457800A
MLDTCELAVNGTLMLGLELNGNLQQVGAEFCYATTTAPIYRLWSIGDRHPAMIRVNDGGRSIDLEIWSLPLAGLAQILQQEPAGLCIGKIKLADNREVLGVLGEPFLCEGQLEITHFGGWRNYTKSVESTATQPRSAF